MIWIHWIKEVVKLEEAFSRKKTFFWAVLVLIGMTINSEFLGVTSFVRCTFLNPIYYPRIIAFFHSSSINLEFLTRLWCKNCIFVLQKFLVVINERYVFAIDGIYAPKEGRKMPGVKSLYQSSQNNSKPEYIMGHVCQMIGVIVKGLDHYFLVPLVIRMFGGIKDSQGKIQNTYDVALILMSFLKELGKSAYILSDAYYAVGKMFLHVLSQYYHIICKIKINAVAYEEPSQPTKKRGRPKLYGDKVILRTLFKDLSVFEDSEILIYGKKEKIKFLQKDLIVKSLKRKVRFCLVCSPERKRKIILLTTDLSLPPEELIKAYSYRFKIESCFREFVHTFHAFMYRFWSKCLDRVKHKDSAQDISHKTETEQKKILNKITAYQIFLQLVVIAQGLIRYLALIMPQEIFSKSNFWMRTQRLDRPPSGIIVQAMLRNSFSDFCASKTIDHPFMKFLQNKQLKLRSPPIDDS